MDDMTVEDIKMHLRLLIKSIQETENWYFIWCLVLPSFHPAQENITMEICS